MEPAGLEQGLILVREFGSFGMIIFLFIVGIKYVPRMIIAVEGIESTCSRIETKFDNSISRVESKLDRQIMGRRYLDD